MTRRKLTPEEKELKNKQFKEKLLKEGEEFDIREMREMYINDPTIFYFPGERIIYGNHPNAEVVEVYDNGKFYKVRAWGKYKIYLNIIQQESIHILSWTDIKKYRETKENDKIEIFTKEDELRLNFSQRNMMDIFSKVYHFGIDMSPEYQRGNVWNLEDKRKLINSIFNNIDIGKFAFIKLPFKSQSPSYEILDGKQRITAIIEFFEDRFAFKGKTYSQLNWRDQRHFYNYAISIAEISNATRKQKLLYFLRLNTGGKLVDPLHLEYVRKLYEEELKNEN